VQRGEIIDRAGFMVKAIAKTEDSFLHRDRFRKRCHQQIMAAYGTLQDSAQPVVHLTVYFSGQHHIIRLMKVGICVMRTYCTFAKPVAYSFGQRSVKLWF
jgi:hypothetical protein